MNKKILLKIIDELNKGKDADLSYMRGVLETIADSLPDEQIAEAITGGVRHQTTEYPYARVQPVPMPDPMSFPNMATVGGEGDAIQMEAAARLRRVDLGSIETQ